MNSMSFGKLYIFRDYSGKCEENEFWKAPEDSRTQQKWAPRKYASRRDKRPTREGEAQPGPNPAQADRPYREVNRAPPGTDQALLLEKDSSPPLRVNLNHLFRSV
jgi:hypothetical protein